MASRFWVNPTPNPNPNPNPLISGLAAGSFTFLAAHELTHTAATSRLSKRTRAALAFAGVGCMAVLAIWV